MTSDLNPAQSPGPPAERRFQPSGGDVVDLGARRAAPVRTTEARPPAVPLRTRLWLVDVVAVCLGWLVAGAALERGAGPGWLAPASAGAATTLVAVGAVGLHRSRRCARVADELPRLMVAAACGAGLSAGLSAVVTTQSGATVQWSASCAGVCLASLGIARWMFGRYLRARRAEGRFLRRVLVVGSNDDARDLRRLLRSEPELGYAVVGVVGEEPDRDPSGNVPFRSALTEIPSLARTTGAGGVLIVPTALSGMTVRQAIEVATGAGLHVQVWSGLGGVGTGRVRSVPIARQPFFYVEPRTSSRWQLVAKRAIDVAGAVVGLALTFPVLLVAALLIKLDDGGPVLHVAERVGRNGALFRIVKLRSMALDRKLSPSALAAVNERTDGPLFKASNDPRVTRVGRLLRASSVDELPQLWNVLRGTMSLVGPRPAFLDEVSQFDAELQRRHSVRPGMTGLWQVEARRNPSFSAYRRLDLHYVDNWSLSLDLAIMAATVPAILGHAGRSMLDALGRGGGRGRTTCRRVRRDRSPFENERPPSPTADDDRPAAADPPLVGELPLRRS